jgi:hypothetical protein
VLDSELKELCARIQVCCNAGAFAQAHILVRRINDAGRVVPYQLYLAIPAEFFVYRHPSDVQRTD